MPDVKLLKDEAPIRQIKEEFDSKKSKNIKATDHQDGYIEEDIMEGDPSILARRAEIGASESRQKYIDIFSSSSAATPLSQSSIIIKNPQFKSPEKSKSNEKAEYAATRHIYNFVGNLVKRA